MLSGIRRRLTFANVTAAIALLLAMSGGAIAARHYLLTSVGQISPKVLKELRGRSGPAGPVGVTGPAGARGPAGASGANGVSVTSRQFTGVAGGCKEGGSEFTSASGTTFACNGSVREGPDEKTEGPRPYWPYVLPPESTVRGTWGFESDAEGVTRVPISFPVWTESPLQPTLGRGPVELLEPHEEDPQNAHPNCPGTVEEPRAEPGFLCVYAEKLEDPLVGEGHMHRSGIVLSFEAKSSAPRADEGTWAMTVP